MLLQDTTHLILRPCYQRGSPCQDPAGDRTTRRPPDHRKETQTAVVWSCLPFIIIIINPLTARVVGAPQMILQPVFSIFPCSPVPSGTCRTPGLSIPRCCLPTSSFVHLVFFPLSLCLARWFWPDLMNGKHDHTTAGKATVPSAALSLPE